MGKKVELGTHLQVIEDLKLAVSKCVSFLDAAKELSKYETQVGELPVELQNVKALMLEALGKKSPELKVYLLVDDTYGGSTEDRIKHVALTRQECIEAKDDHSDWTIIELTL